MADEPRVAVINTGTELLLGQTLNTHLGFLAESLFPLGLRINRQVTLPDGRVIGEALEELLPLNDLVFVTGGLGPTADDVTREIVAEMFDLPLDLDPTISDAIEARVSRRGLKMNEQLRRQAYVPRGSVVLPNPHGTAPGLYFPPGTGAAPQAALFLLPGPPRELKPMVTDVVLPILRELFPETSTRGMRNFFFCGLGESTLEARVQKHLEVCCDLEIGFCARSGEVILRCIGPEEMLQEMEGRLRPEFEEHLVSADGATLETVVVDLLKHRKQTIAVAESCTGGLLANRITDVPGASAVFEQGMVTYSNAAKSRLLGVPASLIEKHGAVSAETAAAMASGLLERAGTDFALTTTGIAGPSGGTPEKPVGTLFVGLATRNDAVRTEKFFYPTDRPTFKFVATQSALNLLRRTLALP